jgi:polyhydroxyalkanoate synthesis regulator phasin
MDRSIRKVADEHALHRVAKIVSATVEGADTRIGPLRETFQRELLGAIDRLTTAAVFEADAAAEKARVAGQIALDEALKELEHRTRQHDELTQTVSRLENQVGELRVALHVERELTRTAIQRYDHEHSARTRAEAASQEAHRLHEQLVSEYESKLDAAQTDLASDRARIGALERQLASHLSARTRIVRALKIVQQECALGDADGQTIEIDGQPAEDKSAHEIEREVHEHSAAPDPDDAAGPNEQSAESTSRDAAVSSSIAAKARQKVRYVGERRPLEVPPTLAEFGKQLFPRNGEPSAPVRDSTRPPTGRTIA